MDGWFLRSLGMANGLHGVDIGPDMLDSLAQITVPRLVISLQSTLPIAPNTSSSSFITKVTRMTIGFSNSSSTRQFRLGEANREVSVLASLQRLCNAGQGRVREFFAWLGEEIGF